MQPPKRYSVGGQRSSRQLPGARPDYKGSWCMVFLPVLNKSQASLHQEVYHSSHPEASDRSLNCNYLHLVRGGTKFLEDQQLPKCKAKSLHLIIMLAAA
ncbi:UNVERIFIED_CONTAM: hypothetical protein FKN15_001249 [Acipenser sinensis]